MPTHLWKSITSLWDACLWQIWWRLVVYADAHQGNKTLPTMNTLVLEGLAAHSSLQEPVSHSVTWPLFPLFTFSDKPPTLILSFSLPYSLTSHYSLLSGLAIFLFHRPVKPMPLKVTDANLKEPMKLSYCFRRHLQKKSPISY